MADQANNWNWNYLHTQNTHHTQQQQSQQSQQRYVHQVIGGTSYNYVSNVNSSYQHLQPGQPLLPPPPPPAYPVNNQNVSTVSVPVPVPVRVAPSSYPVNSYTSRSTVSVPIQPHHIATCQQQPVPTSIYPPIPMPISIPPQQHSIINVTTSVQYLQQPQKIIPPPPPSLPPKNMTTNKKPTKHSNQNTNTIATSPTHQCTTCSITFDSLQAYTSHLSSHIQCTHPNCTFTASKKVVSAHYSQSHGKFSGRGLKTVTIQTPGSKKAQKFKICVGNHPDDVKAWIEERKKRFPTREKMSKLDEKRKRRREEGRLVIMRHCGDGSGGEEKRMKCEKHHLNDKLVVPVASSSASPSKQSGGGGGGGGGETKLQESQDALSNLAYYGSSSSDEEEQDNNKNNNHNNHKKHQDDDDDIEKETIDSQIPIGEDNLGSNKDENANLNDTKNDDDIVEGNATHKYKTKQCRYFLRNGTCKNGNQCTYIHDITQHELYKTNASVRREIQSKKDKAKNEARREVNLITTGRAQGDRTDLPATGQTLLRRLLQNDIRRERSLCLQLLRYIVDCNFLQEQKGKTRNETMES